MLQNARPAAATRVEIEKLGNERGPILRVRDDGRGIADPAKFLTLGDSGWDASIARSEDPAGMGVFSLAGRHVTVRSRPVDSAEGRQVTIPPDAWESSLPLDVVAVETVQSTEIDIDLHDGCVAYLESAVKSAATYFSLPVFYNENLQGRSDFLHGAERIEEWGGCRIGMFRNMIRDERVRINFHGLTVPCKLPYAHDAEGGDGWDVRVEIVDAPDLQLVLPARKEMVEGAALDALRVACEAAIYRTIARKGHHRLPFKQWQRARDLGIPLPEASPWLDERCPRAADEDAVMQGDRIAGEPMIILPYDEAHIEQCLARSLKTGRPLAARPVRPIDAFKGYVWYEVLPRVVGLTYRIGRGAEWIEYDGRRDLLQDLPSGVVDFLGMELAVQASGDP